MRALCSLTLTTLTIIGLIAAVPAFADSANAAAVKAKPAQTRHARVAKRRGAHSYCPPHQVLTNMYFGATRLCVDPVGSHRWYLDPDNNVVYY